MRRRGKTTPLITSSLSRSRRYCYHYRYLFSPLLIAVADYSEHSDEDGNIDWKDNGNDDDIHDIDDNDFDSDSNEMVPIKWGHYLPPSSLA